MAGQDILTTVINIATGVAVLEERMDQLTADQIETREIIGQVRDNVDNIENILSDVQGMVSEMHALIGLKAVERDQVS